MTGYIKNLLPDRGIGWITCTSDGLPRQEYFFHRTDCGDAFGSLTKGMMVDFTEAHNGHDPRKRARDVYICDGVQA